MRLVYPGALVLITGIQADMILLVLYQDQGDIPPSLGNIFLYKVQENLQRGVESPSFSPSIVK